MFKIFKICFPLAILAILGSGCSLSPKYAQPQTNLPDSQEAIQSAQETAISQKWWEEFGDETLNRLWRKHCRIIMIYLLQCKE